MNIIDSDVIFAMAKNLFNLHLKEEEEKRKENEEDTE